MPTESFPFDESMHRHLTTFCQVQGGNSWARKIWQELADSQPNNALWQTTRDEVIVETSVMEGDWELAIVALKRLVSKNFNQPRYMVELEAAVGAWHMSAEDTIALWVDVVDQNPKARILQDRLWKACDQLKRPELIVDLWENLVEAHPLELTLYDRLSLACKLAGSSRDAVRIWEGLVEGPSGYFFSFPLYQALRERGNIHEAVLVWQRRVTKDPLEGYIKELKNALGHGNSTVDEAFEVWNELLTQHPGHRTTKSCFELAYTELRA
jgi:hypothetical protein